MKQNIGIVLIILVSFAFLAGCIGDDKVKKELEDVKSTLDTIKSEKAGLMTDKENLEKDKDDLLRDKDKLEAELEELKANYTDLKKERDELYKEWFDLRSAKLSIDPVKMDTNANMEDGDCISNYLYAKLSVNNSGNVAAKNVKLKMIVSSESLKYDSELVEIDTIDPGSDLKMINEKNGKLELFDTVTLRSNADAGFCDKEEEKVDIYLAYEDKTGLQKGIHFVREIIREENFKKWEDSVISEDFDSFKDQFEME